MKLSADVREVRANLVFAFTKINAIGLEKNTNTNRVVTQVASLRFFQVVLICMILTFLKDAIFASQYHPSCYSCGKVGVTVL